MDAMWLEDWHRVRTSFTRWWRREGPVLMVMAPKDEPWEEMERPPEPADLEIKWYDPYARIKRSMYDVSRTYYGGDGFPMIHTNIGPGSLGTFIGSEPEAAPSTIWYHTCIDDPDSYPEIRFDPDNYWFSLHRVLIETGVRLSRGRYVVGMPDLIENIDILSQMRDPQTLMMDMIERPAWVEKCVAQINRVYFEAFERLYPIISISGGNAFCAFHI